MAAKEKGACFQFKRFAIKQDRCAMKVGVDSVLLGAWARPENCRSVLDVGTGTGVLALMMAQKCTSAYITAIDIDPEAVAQAQENFCDSHYGHCMTAVEADVRTFEGSGAYDCIVCNPPYFNEQVASPSPARQIARHTDAMTHQDLIDVVSRLLGGGGVFYVILPAAVADDFISLAWRKNLHLWSALHVRTKENRPHKRALLSFGRTYKPAKYNELVLTDERGEKLPEYVKLTKDYYLDPLS